MSLIADQYEVRQLITETSLASFYYAYDLMDFEIDNEKRQVILAAVAPWLTNHPDFISMFPQVLGRFSLADSPLKVIDACQSGGVYWIVFPMAKGEETLVDTITHTSASSLSPSETQHILHHILRAAKQIAPKGGFGFLEPGAIFHRDDSYRLLNAPLAIILRILLSSTGEGEKQLALQSAYISPQVASGIPPTPQDDAFSIACIACHLLRGSHPFANASSLEALANRMKPTLLTRLKPELQESLQRGLSLERHLRQSSPYELLHAFTEVPAAPEPSKPHYSWLPKAALAAGIAFTAMAGYHLHTQQMPQAVATQLAPESVMAPIAESGVSPEDYSTVIAESPATASPEEALPQKLEGLTQFAEIPSVSQKQALSERPSEIPPSNKETSKPVTSTLTPAESVVTASALANKKLSITSATLANGDMPNNNQAEKQMANQAIKNTAPNQSVARQLEIPHTPIPSGQEKVATTLSDQPAAEDRQYSFEPHIEQSATRVTHSPPTSPLKVIQVGKDSFVIKRAGNSAHQTTMPSPSYSVKMSSTDKNTLIITTE